MNRLTCAKVCAKMVPKLLTFELVRHGDTERDFQLIEADFQHCFQQWKSRMERCRDRQGEYIEGNKVATIFLGRFRSK
ncbi:hypothetical protein NQ318_017615 [Aromia moschata]|uniref:Uncharacterized protein n=1 Tax=Aromia moschata TaxID=1265417 RepID=A0AAV8Z262_9CUCU|nr:hypothetical protein NQ318_017615 [Aromia moschata]